MQQNPLMFALNVMHAAHQKGRKCLFVFDLDSTLFDVTPRIQRIVDEFAEENSHLSEFPRETGLIKNAKIERSDWGIQHALERLGITVEDSSKFISQIKSFWHQRFFANDYLVFDKPYEGAKAFLDMIYANKLNDIVYLTGRDTHRMEKGTINSLIQHQFPYDAQRATLALKSHLSIDDTEFKKDWFNLINKSDYEEIWLFENEPTNIDKVRKFHPEVRVIFFESTHSAKMPSPKDLPTIYNYLI